MSKTIRAIPLPATLQGRGKWGTERSYLLVVYSVMAEKAIIQWRVFDISVHELYTDMRNDMVEDFI